MAKSNFRETVAETFFTNVDKTEIEQADEGTLELSLDQIDDFDGHVFQVREDADMQTLRESIKKIGVSEPICVRKKEDGRYESITGHRRRYAANLEGIKHIPARVLDVDNDTARLIMVETNLSQRSEILPSEKAKAYKVQLEAMKRKAGRPSKNNSGQVVQNLQNKLSVEVVGEQNGENYKQVHRYIRLNELSPALLDMVDSGKLKMNPAVSLSYLSQPEQHALYEIMQRDETAPSLKQANRLKERSSKTPLNLSEIEIIMRNKGKDSGKLIIPIDQLRRFLPDATPHELQESLIAWAQVYAKAREFTDLFPKSATLKDVAFKTVCIYAKEAERRRSVQDMGMER